MNKKPQYILIPLGIVLLALNLCVALFSLPISGGTFVLSAIMLLLSWKYLDQTQQEQQKQMDTVFMENANVTNHLISAVNIPCLLFDLNGTIAWRNDAFKRIYSGNQLKKLIPEFDLQNPEPSLLFEYESNAYQILNMPIKQKKSHRKLTFQYWLDRTEAEQYRRVYEGQMPYVGLIYVDNYEDLNTDQQFRRNSVLNDVECLISQMVSNIDGIYRRYDNGKFLIVFEAKHLDSLQKNRFSLLEEAYKLDTGTAQHITLSIAIGVADHITQADEAARQAMELALGRGGDQAVVKTGANYAFFGGRRQAETRQSKVRTRLFAKALHQLMESSGDVFIMGHQQPDMDCIGASMGILRCARHVGRNAYIILDRTDLIEQAVNSINVNPDYAGILITPDLARSLLQPSSVLIVVDTQRPSSTIAPDLLVRSQKLVLIDHHRRSAEYIDNATLNYLESRASSASELVAETLQYFDDAIRPTAFECGVLLAGIALDTKHFLFNVGARTFEAATYLRRNGADIDMVKKLFQDDRATYVHRVDTVKNAKLYKNGIAISRCVDGIDDVALIAAQSADELISIRGTEAAFVLGNQNGTICISGRSLGSINVQLILEKLGGGGHLTMAGARLPHTDMDQAVQQLKDSIETYLEEGDIK